MRILDELHALEPFRKPVALTIGNFDGVHRGHLHVISKLQEVGKTSVVLTFSNHPATVLHPNNLLPLLCTNEHKVKIFAEMGVDVTINIPFTESLSKLSPEAFLDQLLPFDLLLLGYDSAFGHEKAGDPERVARYAREKGFSVSKLEPIFYEGKPISSSRVRESILAGNLLQTEHLLGRKFSLYGQVLPGKGIGKKLGFSTANLSTKGLAIPPLGVYGVRCLVEGTSYPAVANLGVAPTVREASDPLLEVHIFDKELALEGKWIEVVFEQFLRPEMKFDSLQSLQTQIAADILAAKKILL